ncbi:MAG TPA: metallophosphoesterase [Kofleriaceae bacterium]|nr:metallophosphoesterase [Kofleriaceae bacterium]
MWFVYVGVALALLIAGGLYARRRVSGALLAFGVRGRRVRVVRWAMTWLLFGYPVLVILAIAGSLILGRDTLPRFDGPLAAWLLAVPFVWAMLVVFQALPWLLLGELAHLVVRRRRGAAFAAQLRAVLVLVALGVFALYTPLRIAIERDDLRVRHHRVGPGAATAATPFRIAFIADIQQDAHTDADRAREVYARVNQGRPDIVLSGGDWINTGPDHIRSAAATAAALESRLGTFSVRGDHEHFAYVDRDRSVAEVERALRASGIHMLNNQVRWFEHGGKQIAVVFLSYNYIHRTDRATIAALVASVAAADTSIAVTHQLDRALFSLLEGKVDLVLGAHTHGGQVNPVLGVAHVAPARLETEFVDGRYQRGATTVIITAGVGYSVVPFRYAAPGSIELIELVP